MSGWALAFLGLIAVATVVTAVIQVGAILIAVRLAWRVEALVARVEQEVQPVLANVQSVSRTASEASTLALAQVERADRLLAGLSGRVDESVVKVERALLAPVREGRAVLTGIGAALGAFGEARRGRRRRVDEEDALFIG